MYGGHGKSITIEESFTEWRRFQIILLFEPLKKHFHQELEERSHIKLRVYFKLND